MEVLLIDYEYVPACMEGKYGAVTGNMVNADGRLRTFLGGREVCGQCRWFLVNICVFYGGGTWILFL
jgi:hypothetical protein